MILNEGYTRSTVICLVACVVIVVSVLWRVFGGFP